VSLTGTSNQTIDRKEPFRTLGYPG